MKEKPKSVDERTQSHPFPFSDECGRDQIGKTAARIEEIFFELDDYRETSMLCMIFLELSELIGTFADSLEKEGIKNINHGGKFTNIFKNLAHIFMIFDRKGSSLNIDGIESILRSLESDVQREPDHFIQFKILIQGFQAYLYSWIRFIKGDKPEFENLLQKANDSFSRINFGNWVQVCMDERSMIEKGLFSRFFGDGESPKTFVLNSLMVDGLKILLKSNDDIRKFRDWNLSRSIMEIADSGVLESCSHPNPSMREMVNRTFLISLFVEFFNGIRSIPKLGNVGILVSLESEICVTEGQSSVEIPITVVNPRNEVAYDLRALQTTYVRERAIAERLFPNEDLKTHLTLSLPKTFSSLFVDISIQYSTTFNGLQIISTPCVIYSKKQK